MMHTLRVETVETSTRELMKAAERICEIEKRWGLRGVQVVIDAIYEFANSGQDDLISILASMKIDDESGYILIGEGLMQGDSRTGEAFSFSPDGETLTYIYNEVSDDDEGEEDGEDDIPTDLTGLVKWLNNKLIVVEV